VRTRAAKNSSGPAMPGTMAIQRKEPIARAVSGMTSEPSSGAQAAITTAAAAISVAASAAGPAVVRSRP